MDRIAMPALRVPVWQLSRRVLATWVVGLFTIDLLFLPMFHVAGLPLKAGYLLLPLYLGEAARRRAVLPLSVMCWMLVAVCAVGSLQLFVLDPGARFEDTVRNSLILGLVPLAFAFGWRIRPGSLDFLLVLMPTYLAINAVLTFWYRDLPWLVQFYQLEARVVAGLFDIRSPGIHFNPNLSSLAANLLLLAAVAADRAGLLRSGSLTLRWVAFLSVLSVHVLMGSRGEMLSALVLGGFWVFYRAGADARHRLFRLAWAGGLAAILTVALLSLALPYLAKRSALFDFAWRQFRSVNLVTRAQILDPSLRGGSLLMRPFMEIERVAARVRVSPLWGTGFDRASVPPFEETYFHNDWAVVLVAGGVIGLLLLVLIVRFFASNGFVFLVPFLLTAPANSFILAPSHLLFYVTVAGCVAWKLANTDSDDGLVT